MLHNVWHVGAMAPLPSLNPPLHTHSHLVMLRETELCQNTVILHSFQQKLTQELRQNNYLPEIICGVYFVKQTAITDVGIIYAIFRTVYRWGYGRPYRACAVQQWCHHLTACVLKQVLNASNVRSDNLNK